MSVTTIKVTSEVRERLAEVADRDFAGSTLGDTVERLLAEHEEVRLRQEILDGYARLQADPAAWAEYLEEVEDWSELGAEAVRGGDE